MLTKNLKANSDKSLQSIVGKNVKVWLKCEEKYERSQCSEMVGEYFKEGMTVKLFLETYSGKIPCKNIRKPINKVPAL